MKFGSNVVKGLQDGKKLGDGLLKGSLQGVGKAAITPGSGIGAGAELAGNLLQGTDNPALQGIGKGLGVASNFAPGGGGIAGAVGDVAGLAGGAAGGAAGGGQGLMNMLQGAGGAGGAAGAGGGLLGMAGQLLSAENGVKTPNAEPPQTDGDIMRQEMLDQRQSERDMANSGGLGRRALDMSRGVDMDRSSSGQLDSGAAYSGPKYRMAELNEIARGVYDKDVDYDRLAYSMDNASSKHQPALSNILANQTTMRQFNGGAVSNNKEMMETNMAYGGTPRRGVKLMKRGGGPVYASNGNVTPTDPQEPKQPYDGRSYLQKFVDEAGQIGAGILGMDDSLDSQSNLGMTGSTSEKSVFDMLSRIPSDFMKAYLEQEESDRAEAASGKEGMVDAFGTALGAFSKGFEGNSPSRIGGEETTSVLGLTPFADAQRAFDRARMTFEERNQADAARKAARQFAGGRAPVRLRKR